MKSQILNLIVTPWPRWLTKSRLARELGTDDKDAVQEAISELENAGSIVAGGRGKGKCYGLPDFKPELGIPNSFVIKLQEYVLSNQLCSMNDICEHLKFDSEICREIVNEAIESGFVAKHGNKRACRYYAGDFQPPAIEPKAQTVKDDRVKKAPVRGPGPSKKKSPNVSEPASPEVLPEDDVTVPIEIKSRQHGDIEQAFAYALKKMKKGGAAAKDTIDFSKKLIGKLGSGYEMSEVQEYLYQQMREEKLPHVMQNLGEGYRAYVWIPAN